MTMQTEFIWRCMGISGGLLWTR